MQFISSQPKAIKTNGFNAQFKYIFITSSHFLVLNQFEFQESTSQNKKITC